MMLIIIDLSPVCLLCDVCTLSASSLQATVFVFLSACSGNGRNSSIYGKRQDCCKIFIVLSLNRVAPAIFLPLLHGEPGIVGVLHQHRYGHGTHATGNRCDEARDFGC